MQQQLSELTGGTQTTNGGSNNGGSGTGTNGIVIGTAPGPSSGSGASAAGSGAGDETGYVPQDYDGDYHSLPDTHPGYVESSPEFYTPSLMADKSFQQNTAFMTKNFARSKSQKHSLIF